MNLIFFLASYSRLKLLTKVSTIEMPVTGRFYKPSYRDLTSAEEIRSDFSPRSGQLLWQQ